MTQFGPRRCREKQKVSLCLFSVSLRKWKQSRVFLNLAPPYIVIYCVYAHILCLFPWYEGWTVSDCPLDRNPVTYLRTHCPSHVPFSPASWIFPLSITFLSAQKYTFIFPIECTLWYWSCCCLKLGSHCLRHGVMASLYAYPGLGYTLLRVPRVPCMHCPWSTHSIVLTLSVYESIFPTRPQTLNI